MGDGGVGNLAKALRLVLQPERIEDLPVQPPAANSRSFIGKLFEAEVLPFDEPPPAPRGRASAGLFAAEALPFDEPPPAQRSRRSFLSVLFAGERLPEDPDSQPAADNQREKRPWR